MNKRLLSVVGVFALLAWTLGGVAAWALTKEGLQITVQEGSSADQGNDGMAQMEDQLGALQKDLGGLAKTLGHNFQLLQESLSEESRDNRAQLEARIEKLSNELATLRAEQNRDRTRFAQQSATIMKALEKMAETQKTQPSMALVARAHTKSTSQPASPIRSQPDRGPSKVVPETQSQKASPPKPKKKKRSFLSFDLPSQTVAFDKRQHWKLIPSLSRVGFDGKSTLHDFSGVTSKLRGSLEVDLSHPDKNPKTKIQVQAAMLKTGVDGRDEEMYTTLDTKMHPEITFELISFASKSLDAKAEKVTGVAHGKMTIHGVSREVDMPTTLRIDSSRRLHIDGEMPLDLTDYKITPPSKMGLVGMDKEIKVWIRLRARIQEGN